MSVSAVMIAYNEEELLPSCLTFLESLRQVAEVICIVDQDTNDRTMSILDHYATWSSKTVIWRTAKMNSLGELRNIGMDIATQEWILSLDPDEVFTPQLDGLLADVHNMPNINAVRLPCIVLYIDRRHYLDQATIGMDPHIHIWRRGFARYESILHADVIDVTGRRLHNCNDPDVMSTYNLEKYYDVGMKHMQLLKSDAALIEKGMRWQATGALAESTRTGIPIDKSTWLGWKRWAFQTHRVLALPERWHDLTSDW